MKVIGSELLNKYYYHYYNKISGDFSMFKSTDGISLKSSYTPSSSGVVPSLLTIRKSLGEDLDQTDITNMSNNYNNKDYNSGTYDVIIGSGTTPPTYEDYKIEQQIKLTVVNISVGYDEIDKSSYIIKTLTNNNEESVTINEIGIIMYCYNDFFNPSKTKNILISRDVLETGFIVGPGETINIKLKNNSVSVDYT